MELLVPLDRLEQHYRRQWGQPDRRASFRFGDRSYQVLKWRAENNPLDVHLYATLGASTAPMRGAPMGHRVEFFLGLLPDRDDVALSLAMLAEFPHQEQTELDHGHTVTFEDPLWHGTDMRSFLVMRQVATVAPALALPGHVHVEFLQAIPVHAAELTYKATYGADALRERWRRANVPLWQPDRASATASEPLG